MSLYPKFRDVHLWVGLIVLLPIVAISVTGVMLNHENALGLKFHEHEKDDKMRKERDEKKEKEGEHKDRDDDHNRKDNHDRKYGEKTDRMASAERPRRRQTKKVTSDFACKPGVWQSHQESIDVALASAMAGWGKEMPLEKVELKDEPGLGMVVKIKSAKGSYAKPDEFIYQVANGRLLEKTEEGNWIKDLHTGKLFHDYWGFMFSDTAGIALVALSLTGIVLYAIPIIKKRSKKKKTPAPRPSAAALKQMGGSPLPAKPQSNDA